MRKGSDGEGQEEEGEGDALEDTSHSITSPPSSPSKVSVPSRPAIENPFCESKGDANDANFNWEAVSGRAFNDSVGWETWTGTIKLLRVPSVPSSGGGKKVLERQDLPPELLPGCKVSRQVFKEKRTTSSQSSVSLLKSKSSSSTSKSSSQVSAPARAVVPDTLDRKALDEESGSGGGSKGGDDERMESDTNYDIREDDDEGVSVEGVSVVQQSELSENSSHYSPSEDDNSSLPTVSEDSVQRYTH